MDRLVVIRKGAIEVAFPPIDVAPIVVGPLVSRIEADRVVVVAKSTVQIALMVVCNGPIGIGDRANPRAHGPSALNHLRTTLYSYVFVLALRAIALRRIHGPSRRRSERKGARRQENAECGFHRAPRSQERPRTSSATPAVLADKSWSAFRNGFCGSRPEASKLLGSRRRKSL